MKKIYTAVDRRRLFPFIATVWLILCTACGLAWAANDYNDFNYASASGNSSSGGSHSIVQSFSNDRNKPIFSELPEKIVLTEGESFHRDFSVQYIFPDSLNISLIAGNNIDDAVIDMGGGRGFFYLMADHTMVDSTFLYIFMARHGRVKTLDTMIVSVINRPLEIVSVLPEAGSEILVSEKPIRIRFNELIDPSSVGNGVIVKAVGGERFESSYIKDDKTLVIDCKSRRLPARDTISVYLTSGLLDLAGHSMDRPVRLVFATGPLVFPGDANDDGIVDKNDIIPIVRFWGCAGPNRATAQSTEWTAQASYSWNELMAAYADVNGDGIVNGDDVCGIIANWGRKIANFSIARINSSEAPEKILARSEQIVLKDLYTAVINCSEGEGRESVVHILKSLLFDDRENLPNEYILYQNYPNPFNPETIIEYYMPYATQLKIGVYNIIGQKVYDLHDGFAPEGFGSVTWYGIDNFGKPVASGIYFYRLETENLALTKRMILIR